MLVYQRVTIKHDGKSMVLEPVETVFQQLVNRDANAMNNGNGCA
jgi:virulence-associated protein VagC